MRPPLRTRRRRRCPECKRDRTLHDFRLNASKCMDCAGTRPVVRDHEGETAANLADFDRMSAAIREECGA